MDYFMKALADALFWTIIMVVFATIGYHVFIRVCAYLLEDVPEKEKKDETDEE